MKGSGPAPAGQGKPVAPGSLGLAFRGDPTPPEGRPPSPRRVRKTFVRRGEKTPAVPPFLAALRGNQLHGAGTACPAQVRARARAGRRRRCSWERSFSTASSFGKARPTERRPLPAARGKLGTQSGARGLRRGAGRAERRRVVGRPTQIPARWETRPAPARPP